MVPPLWRGLSMAWYTIDRREAGSHAIVRPPATPAVVLTDGRHFSIQRRENRQPAGERRALAAHASPLTLVLGHQDHREGGHGG